MVDAADRLASKITAAIRGAGLDELEGLAPAGAAYLALLEKWNATHNLTAVRAASDMVDRHLIDAWAVAADLPGRRVADAGSGAGLPGIPLALARTELEFVLIERSGKKCAFIRQAVAQLGLENVVVAQADLQDYRPDQPFDTVVARALAPMPKLVDLVAPLLTATTELWAFKGARVEQELVGLSQGFEVMAVTARTTSDGYLVRVRRASP